MTSMPLLANYIFALISCTNYEFSNFQALHLNYEKFKLCLQNTLNMSKTTRVYFGVLQVQLSVRQPVAKVPRTIDFEPVN